MLLDTSGLLCLLHRDKPQHPEASRLFTAAPYCLTHNYVLSELVALAHVRGVPRRPTLDFLRDLRGVPRVEVVWVDESLHERALDLLERRLDKSYSLCDAVSFLLMRERSISEALTTDRHFAQEGFTRLLQP
ncbi:MAG: type II toxin-antitoxin system VapC family toxin [Pyrinomonadaceae bacterium]